MTKAKTPKATRVAELETKAPDAAAPDPKTREKTLILIVDDVADNRDIYADFLRFKGFDVEEANDGFQAVEKARALLPDLVLMDLSLPGMDGWEAARKIKGNPNTRHIKIVAVTGHALDGTSEGAKEAGCDGFLAKPCLPGTLETEIRRMLESGKTRAKAPRTRT